MPDNPLHQDPITQFKNWFEKAKSTSTIIHPDAACLSTIDEAGYPDGRIVLIKAISDAGLDFFTNMHSPKAIALINRPKASLTVHWESLHYQVRIQGNTHQLDDDSADHYFAV